MEFEGIKVKVPNDWDYFLRQFYGDYMKLPPKEKRVMHQTASSYSLGLYEEYARELLEKLG